MKEKIYTIPLSEAFEEDSECPFCLLERKLEQEAAEYAVGASMMEPDSRVVSNEKGFCRRHFKMMAEQSKALSLALVLDTHLSETVRRLQQAAGSGQKGLFKKGKSAREACADEAKQIEASCVICEKLDKTLHQFGCTFWYLMKNETDFRAKVLAGKGFCLPHFALLLETAQEELGGRADALTDEVIHLEIQNLQRVEEDVNWFTKKFDYRYQDAPWKNAKDAPARAMEKLAKFQQ